MQQICKSKFAPITSLVTKLCCFENDVALALSLRSSAINSCRVAAVVTSPNCRLFH